jgi:hypothetical protein
LANFFEDPGIAAVKRGEFGQGSISSYTPDALDSLGYWMNQVFYGDSKAGQQQAEKVLNFGKFVLPGATVPFYAKDVLARSGEGNYLVAAQAGGNALLNAAAIPGVGGAYVKGVQAVGKPLLREGRALLADERGTFTGKLASTFPKEKEPLANKLWQKGASLEDIYDQTGLFPSITTRKRLDLGDQRYEMGLPEWQFEISDKGAKFNAPTGAMPQTLGSYMDHPELYAAYPELKDQPLAWKPGRGGSYEPTRNWHSSPNMLLGTDSAVDGGTAIHETQHAVQNIEGFAGGASTETLRPSARPLFQEKLAQAAQIHKDGIPEPVRKSLFSEVAQTGYKRSAGEVEANNVMDRMRREKYLAEYQAGGGFDESLPVPEGWGNTGDFSKNWAKDEALALRYPWKTESLQPRNQLIDQELFRGRRPDSLEMDTEALPLSEDDLFPQLKNWKNKARKRK